MLAVKNDTTGKWESEPWCSAVDSDLIDEAIIRDLHEHGLVKIDDGFIPRRGHKFTRNHTRSTAMVSATAKGMALIASYMKGV
jgi:hypothetical protein